MSFDQSMELLLESGGAVGLMPGMAETRARHARHFRNAGVPTPRIENWKYTPLRLLDGFEFGPIGADATALSPEDLPALGLPLLDGWRVVLVNGRVIPSLGFLDGLPGGFSVQPLTGSNPVPGWAEKLLDRDFEAPDESMASLNGALLTDGLVFDVSPGTVLDQPLQVIHLSVSGTNSELANTRILIRLGAHSQARLVEHYFGAENTPNLNNDVTQVMLDTGAEFKHVRVQEQSADGIVVTRSMVDQQADSRFVYHGVDLGGRLVRHDLIVRLLGQGAECRLHGVYALDGQRHVDNHLRVDHVAPNAFSHEFFKGVLSGKCRGVFNGKVVVHPGADGTDATQVNGNLLLSRTAEVDTKPELEIYADDVRCSHGATVGELDPTQLFYLRSRGIPEQQARTLLTDAFCREVVDTLDHQGLRDYISARISDHLPPITAKENTQ